MNDIRRQEFLSDILGEMIALRDDCDIEYSHGKADDLLCEALKSFGCEELVKAGQELDKWYA